MNEVLASRYAELIHRLAVGIEPRDAVRVVRVAGRLDVRLEKPAGLRAAQLLRHPGNRWSLRYVPSLPASVDVVIADARRRYAPRRLRFPVVSEAQVRAAEQAGGHVPATERTWRPVLYPGAAYEPAPTATGVRGRARRAGEPARWVRVEAVARGTTRVVGRAHGDDRGEFLLVVAPDPAAPAELQDKVELTVRVRARKPAPTPPAGTGAADPFWDLPLEQVAPPGPDDPVSTAIALPPGYTPGFSDSRDVDLVPGRIAADPLPFDLS